MTFHDSKQTRYTNNNLSEKLFGLIFDLPAETFTDPEDISEDQVLYYDEDGWSEPLPLVPEIIGLLVNDDVVRFSRLDPVGQPWNKVAQYADHYFSIQLKKRVEPYPIDTTHPNYYLLTAHDVAIPLGRFGNFDTALAHAKLAWSDYEGYVVTAQSVRRYLQLIDKHEELDEPEAPDATPVR